MIKSAMQSEYIEIIIQPNDRVELIEFATALTAINAEYRQWLREHPTLDHNDQDLRLFVEKISEGSIKIWITKAKDILFDTLEDFYKECIEEFYEKLINGKLDSDTSSRQLKNSRALLKWDSFFKYKSHKRSIEFTTSISGESRLRALSETKELLAEKDVVEAKGEVIKFSGFHKESNAKVIASNFSDQETKTFLAPEVRDFFIQEKNNFLHPDKEYLVDMEVTYRHGEVESYLVTRVLGS